MRRRSVLSALGLGAGIGLLPAPILAGSLQAYPFGVGVAAGDPAPDGFVLWTRLVTQPEAEHGGMPPLRVPVRWEVALDDGFRQIVRDGEAMAHPELAHAVHVEVEGLLPHRRYWYRFHAAGEATSPVGTVRTAPAAGAAVDRVRFAVAGCQHYEHGFYNAWGLLAREPDLDVVFHYGDYIYEGGPGQLGMRGNGVLAVRQHVGGELYSLDDYRRRYAQYKSDPDLQAAHASAAFACSFDDHEVDNNWAAGIPEENVPPEVFALRRRAAMQAWYENMPVRRAMFPSAPDPIAFRRLDYGRLMRMHVLDTRSHRSDQPCDDGRRKPCLREHRVEGTLLGARQEAWLEEGLGGPFTWNVLAQQLLLMPVDLRQPDQQHPELATDVWDGYRGARDRLLGAIQDRGLTNVVAVSGDYHRNLVGEVPLRDTQPEGEKVAVEFLATSMSSESPKAMPPAEHVARLNPHLALLDDERGYHLFDVTPERMVADLKSVATTKRRDLTPGPVTRFVVMPDQPLLHRD